MNEDDGYLAVFGIVLLFIAVGWIVANARRRTESAAYYEGYAAQKKPGVAFNPYADGTKECADWRRGADHAIRDSGPW